MATFGHETSKRKDPIQYYSVFAANVWQIIQKMPAGSTFWNELETQGLLKH
jgi:hypothetical protein